MGKLPAGFARYLVPLLVSLCMTCAVSAIATIRAVATAEEFFACWPLSWLISWSIAYPVMLLLLPVMGRFVGRVCQAP